MQTATSNLCTRLEQQLEQLQEQGLYKKERIITSPQDSKIRLTDDRNVINLCANNYLGLANHPSIIDAASKALHDHGFGMASVRFICGTQDLHKELEQKLSEFLGTEDTILYNSCFDANGGLFETLLTAEDAIISDSLNHASLIDGIRLCKAQRFVYQNSNMQDLEDKLKESQSARIRFIVTDGVFSMDGLLANLPAIRKLADQYDALIVMDDCHATGFMGANGKGTHEHYGLVGKIDILTGTLGKALGGASGGYISSSKPIVEWLRQRSRPYLFSNTIAPPLAAAGIEALRLVQSLPQLRQQLMSNTRFFREEIEKLGFETIPGEHPIIPIMIHDAAKASLFADKLLEKGVYVIAFSFPVVPKGLARIRTQMSAALTNDQLKQALEAFKSIGQELGLI